MVVMLKVGAEGPLLNVTDEGEKTQAAALGKPEHDREMLVA